MMRDDVFTVTLGDWSLDGHQKYCGFDYQASHTIEEQQNAYHQSVTKTGLFFQPGKSNDPNGICNTYQKNTITGYHIEILRRYAKIDCTEFGDDGPNGFTPSHKKFAQFFLWFIGLSLPGFEHTNLITRNFMTDKKEDSNKFVNGWWSNLNITIGYGLWDNYHIINSAYRDLSHQHTSKKFLNVKYPFSVYSGRVICGLDYDIMVPAQTDNIIFDEYESPENCKSDFLKDFLNTANGRVVRAGNRYFFEDELD